MAVATVERPAVNKATQMNVRIDAELKNAGDLALAEYGITPTTFVRLMWELAARRDEALLQLITNELTGQTSEDIRREKALEAALNMKSTIKEEMAKVGIKNATLPPFDPSDYEDLLAEALLERMKRDPE